MQRKRERIIQFLRYVLRPVRERLFGSGKPDKAEGAARGQERFRAGASHGHTAPSFSQSSTAGLSTWLTLAQRLEDCGTHSYGALHAGLVRSELALAEALEQRGVAASTVPQPSPAAAWKTLAEQIREIWSVQNQRLLKQWQENFEKVQQSWRSEGPAHSTSPWPEALERCAQAVDRVWMGQWVQLQTLLDTLGPDLCTQLDAVLQQNGFKPLGDKAQSALEGTFRRAQGDLWGVWSTQAALLRDAARKVIEKKADLTEVYTNTLNTVEGNLNAALEGLTDDVSRAWTQVTSELI